MNRKGWVAVITGLALGMSAASVATTAEEPQRVFASRLAGMQAAGVSGYQIQNLSRSRSMTIATDLYPVQRGDGPGSSVPVSINTSVAAVSAVNGFLPQQAVLRGDIYSALAWADQPIGAIVRTDWFASGGAALYSDVRLGSEVALPLAMVDYAGASSIVFVQNANPGATETIHVELRGSGSSDPVVTFDVDVAGGHSELLDLARDSRFGDVLPNTELGFLGSMTFRAEGPIGVQSYVDYGRSDKAVIAFEGVPTDHASTTLYAPLIRSQFFGYDTGVSVVNPNPSDAEVTLRYVGADAGGVSRCGGRVYEHGPVTIAAESSWVFYQGPGGGSGLPDTCLGSAVIEATQPVLAVVNDSLHFTEQSAAYNAVRAEDGATFIALPLVRRQHIDAWKLTTGIQVMNVGDAVATVTIAFADAQGHELTGCGAACSATIAPNSSHTFYPGAGGMNVLPAGTYGSALITADGPVVALVNDGSETGAIDAAMYAGIGADIDGTVSNDCDPAREGRACVALPSLFNAVDHRAP